MRTTIMMAGLALAVAGCAHQQKETVETTAQPAPAPAPKPQVQVTPTAPTDDGAAELDQVLRSTIVYFDFDSDVLKADGQQALQRMSEVLRKHPALKVRIEGNCDERGTEEYNLVLGERRAAAARKYLLALGAGEQQVDTISYGALRPANVGHTEEAWSQNRRDELTVAAK